MRIGVGKKLNTLLILLLGMGIGGATMVATGLFKEDLVGLVRKGILESSLLFSGRVRSEMKLIAERAQTLGAVSLQEFKYPEDRLQFIRENFSSDTKFFAIALYSLEPTAPADAMVKPDNRAKPENIAQSDTALKTKLEWRVIQPEFRDKYSAQEADFTALDLKASVLKKNVGLGEVEFSVANFKDQKQLLRMAVPLAKDAEGKISQVVVVDLDPERIGALFSDALNSTVYLVDRGGVVLGSTDLKNIPLAQNMSALPIVKAREANAHTSGQLEFSDAKGVPQMGAFSQVGFAGLTVVSQDSYDRFYKAQIKLFRRMGLLVLFFISFGLSVALVFSKNLKVRVSNLARAAQAVRIGDLKVRLRDKYGKVIGEDKRAQKKQFSDEIDEFTEMFNHMVQGLDEREKMRRLIEKFHNEKVAQKLLAGDLSLGGERLDATVLFTDIRGFTDLSEREDPEQIVKILNRYLTKMVSIIFEHGGIVDKYVGDSIMAVWGVPEAHPTDALNAVMACLHMRSALNELNQEFKREGLPELRIGMGLNRGSLIAGNIGSDEKMEYTVIGDTVNTAARIQDLTKMHGTDLLISETVFKETVGRILTYQIGEVVVRGKREKSVLYKVSGYINHGGERIAVETPYSSYEKGTLNGAAVVPPPAPIKKVA